MTSLILGLIVGGALLLSFGYLLYQWHQFKKREAEYDDLEARLRFYDGR